MRQSISYNHAMFSLKYENMNQLRDIYVKGFKCNIKYLYAYDLKYMLYSYYILNQFFHVFFAIAAYIKCLIAPLFSNNENCANVVLMNSN